ncbi:MAG: hypothetical protein K0Q66_1009 [Chitinophagaceae bacterium]|nr:hypothetical protein [Chitinophagaceae bacterium]
MAKYPTIFTSGKVGTVICYEWKGMPCVRSMPAHVRQTKNTKAAAKRFGHAKTISRLLREGMETLVPDYRAAELMYRVDNAAAEWLKQADPDHPGPVTGSLNGLELNVESELRYRLKNNITVDWDTPGKVIVQIPAMDLFESVAAPSGTVMLQLRISATGCMVQERDRWETKTATIDIPFEAGMQGARSVELPYRLKQGCLSIVAVSLVYFKKKRDEAEEVKEQRWLPARIVSAYYGK